MTIAPTPERIAKGDIAHSNAPSKSERVYRNHGQVAKLFENQLCQEHHVRAFVKYEQHYHGALGHDVRMSGERGDSHTDVESPRTYHAQKIIRANLQLSQRQQWALEKLILDAHCGLDQIGAELSGYSDRRQTTAYATAVIVEALEGLAKWWGMK